MGGDVVDQMLARGLEMPPMPLDVSGRVRRFGPKKNHWYKLRELRTDAGAYVVVGSFGNHKGQERWRVEVDWKGLGQEERERMQAQRQASAQAEREARAKLARLSELNAADLWRTGSPTGTSAYLAAKGVDPEACRFLPDGSIVIPLLRYDLPREQALKGAQRIFADGQKRFTRGLDKPGTCVRLGLVVAGEPILVCEGYATGLSVRMALERRLPVFVAVDAGNLLRVCELLRELYPASPLLICADDDFRTPGNPGREKAHKAAKAVPGARYTYPIFMTRGPKDTDFNDLHLRHGLGAVRRQLQLALPLVAHVPIEHAA